MKIIYKSNTKVFLCVATIDILFSLFTLSFAKEQYYLLGLLNILYMTIVLLPFILSYNDLMHPLIIQSLFQIAQVMFIFTIVIGYTNILNHFIISVSDHQALCLYEKTIFLNCIGLIFEYVFCFCYIDTDTNYFYKIKKTNYIILLLIISIVSFIILMRQSGGMYFVLENYAKRLTEFSDTTNNYARYLIGFGTICLLYYYINSDKFLFYLTLCFQLFMYICMGERGGIIVYTLLPMLIANQYVNNKINISYILGILLLCICFYAVIAFFRDTYDSTSISMLNIFSNITHFTISAEVVNSVDNLKCPLLYGLPLFNIFISPIPRSIFPCKPQFTADLALIGSIILNRTDHVFGMPPGIFAYGYINFHWFGVIIFAAITGYIVRIFYIRTIGCFKHKHLDVPHINILIYVLFAPLIYNIFSTEAQEKMIVYLVAMFVLHISTLSCKNIFNHYQLNGDKFK